MDPKLYLVVISGDQRFFENLRNTDSYNLLQVTSGCQNSVLHIAAKCGELQMAEKIIPLHPSLLHQTNSKGDSPLHIASRLGRLQVTQFLINCAKLIEVEVEKELLRMQNLEKDTALHEAARNGHFEIVNLLINEEPELARVVNNSFLNWLTYAFVNLWLVEFLIVLKNMVIQIMAVYWKIFVLYINKFLPASSKIRCSQIKLSYKFSFIGANFIGEVLKRCLSAISEADKFGWIPLHHAAYLGNAEVVDLLLQFDTSLASVEDKAGTSALHISAKAGHDDVVLQLIAKYPDMSELLDNTDRTALQVAAESGRNSVVKVFLSTLVFADIINNRGKDGNAPFHCAALQGHCKTLLLLANDCRVDKGAINKWRLTTFDITKLSTKFRQHGKVFSTYPRCQNSIILQNSWTNTERFMAIFFFSLPNTCWLKIEDKRYCKKFGRIGHHKKKKCMLVMLRNMTNHYKERKEPGKGAAEALHEEAKPAREKKNASQCFKEIGNVNLLVVTIIAAVNFVAGFRMPGGYYKDGQDNQGLAILSKASGFRVFVMANSFAFGLSTASMFLNFGASGVKRDYIATFLLKYAFLLSEWSIYAMVLAFLAGTSVVRPIIGASCSYCHNLFHSGPFDLYFYCF
ncbi:LOW QUALITY PROTEIN: protein ACCELERATED CELL DEATH 6 [Jatropha curcas]|uniref:LOW QUALITY PROTEIN: protein ACCELERATED CELL DEATH 6 n=1 Tax=Jatropha curcas TaxID=180498 RepID=UPI001895B891|nr:LOW QUALITY PROTEIN: protein ACCELERATED CELL DEATH 6 [Jatropha curcas]